MRARATVLALLMTAAAGAGTRSASAQEPPDKSHCLQSYERGQSLLDEHKLTAARRPLMTCVNEACPAVLRKDCMDWLRDLEARQPTAVFRTVDQDARDILTARIFVDGTLLTNKLGVANAVDPGPHAITVEADGWLPLTEHVVFSEGEKNRSLVFRLRPQAGPSRDATGPFRPEPSASSVEPSAAGRRVPALSYLLGGIGVAALGTFAYLGVTGDGEYRDLESGCGMSRSCGDDEVNAVRTKLVAADIALGIGLAAIGSAVLVFLLQPTTSTVRAR